jgi:hypothetical protein
MELDRVPLWRGDGEAKNDVSVKQLMDDFATYLYLPRLTSPEVLIAAIRDGLERLTWPSETFAYAQGKDEETGRYVGLRAGGPTQVIADGRSLVVKADVAKAQMDADAAAAASVAVSKPTPSAAPGSAVGAATLPGVTPSATAEPSEPAKPVYRRFHGNVELDTQRVGVKAGDVAREVIQHLATLPMANVKVTLEIEADLPGGTPDDVIRTVSENCRTLRFENHGFEES